MITVRNVGTIICFAALLAIPAKGADNAAVKRSVDEGVKALKSFLAADGAISYPKVGATALAGIALLECDVPADDASIRPITAYVRRASPTLTDTYSLALSVIYLDLIGEDRDIPLIESMVARLVEGQDATGGWTYSCPQDSLAERARLTASLNAYREGSDNADVKPTKKDGKREPREVTPEIKKRIAEIANRTAGFGADQMTSDNSNTQFALLGLWVGRRYSLPVDNALDRVEERFRKMQNSDGGWGYRAISLDRRWNPAGSTYSMTCAGLLGLAVGQGTRTSLKTDTDTKTKAKSQKDKNSKDKTHDDPGRDKAVSAGLRQLASAIGKPIERDANPRQIGPVPRAAGNAYYLLWSMERVAVAYGLETIGNKDWYAWASDVLVLAQRPDGTWEGGHGAYIDTSFALLTLRKANLASDLTVALRGKVKDPSLTSLKSTTTSKEKAKPIKEESDVTDLEQAKPPKDLQPDKELTRPAETKAVNETGSEATNLVRDLLEGTGNKKQKALDAYREGRGSAYTHELATAIVKLDGEDRKKARAVLADRLSEMTAATLGEKLKDENAEIRRAAALACAMKEEKVHVAHLIEMLDDADVNVRRAAYASLKSLTSQDFGPAKNASAEEIFASMKAWQAWWKKQNDK